ncbi:flagellar hook assembly protein FlgD [Bacillus cytotoxicus]|uniref:Flagellar hook capping protein n=1 Tax=Bacillus cytotoxicus (strain DSM 22905 / CIP 110041 / 391-98 / NVH 391-98) TaxID=315749 RepID=A7GNH8_BACCN|nr:MULTISPECIES: flagellar hook assembly protein FlgD [Bacillus cereus group]ABS21686.1 flagellar hook capping protein [Bacillus cytotoxicus NVH 391-98]AWC44384.1 flagellar basal body rod modification protein [Bacillus cytotoxicus]MDH2863049.1 flagellar hook assembly protein FlgD [Bacillus cytotoxicus]MDH2883022.1 flagellar hook assembly protein FlgD [Bacillus cytotoxicus]MDH2886982.1 flagellar hook assembly protein FlgD [Bacillus cytotoxicus]
MPSVGLNATNMNHMQATQTQAQTKAGTTTKADEQKTPGVMGKDDFLKLFLTSLQYQDPFNAMDMDQMMNQMSQMSLMEQVQNMTKAVNALKDTVNTTALDGGMKFLGKYILGPSTDGNQISGKVDAVRLAANNEIQLVVGDKIVLMKYVTNVSDKEIETIEKPEQKEDIKTETK